MVSGECSCCEGTVAVAVRGATLAAYGEYGALHEGAVLADEGVCEGRLLLSRAAVGEEFREVEMLGRACVRWTRLGRAWFVPGGRAATRESSCRSAVRGPFACVL